MEIAGPKLKGTGHSTGGGGRGACEGGVKRRARWECHPGEEEMVV